MLDHTMALSQRIKGTGGMVRQPPLLQATINPGYNVPSISKLGTDAAWPAFIS
ncbi:hypothetical protein NOC27_918 [Nitrosococcus oceani AFC27]|nr:hypothetical protein NOC27_918 [Nitrosococcus oceani AFC27]